MNCRTAFICFQAILFTAFVCSCGRKSALDSEPIPLVEYVRKVEAAMTPEQVKAFFPDRFALEDTNSPHRRPWVIKTFSDGDAHRMLRYTDGSETYGTVEIFFDTNDVMVGLYYSSSCGAFFDPRNPDLQMTRRLPEQ